MVSNQYVDPFDRVKTYSIGFDRMFNTLLDAPASTGYPPYNIVKVSEEKYCIELAIAGFSKSDIEIESKDNILTISTLDKKDENELETEYLHKGISARSFKKAFNLAEYVIVQGASFKDGILSIDLERIVPEAMKPKTIKIK
jgi:molecular chaperone IbpA